MTSPTFNSYFGDYMHGLWIQWTDKPNPTGTAEVEIKFTANYRAMLQCYQSSANPGSFSTAIDAALKTNIETAGGKVHQYDLNAASGTKAYNGGTPNTANLGTMYDFYVQWTDGTNRDGIRAQALYTVKVGTKTTESAFQSAPSTSNVEWLVSGTAPYDGSVAPYNPTVPKFDVTPTADYDVANTIYDTTDDVTILDAVGTNLCTANLALDQYTFCCTEMVGNVKRNKNTSDAADIIIDYAAYNMVAKFGWVDPGAATTVQAKEKFDQVSVDFASFNLSLGAERLFGLSSLTTAVVLVAVTGS